MKKLNIFITIVALFFSSCVSIKLYESQRIAFTDSIGTLNTTINTLQNDTLQLNQSIKERDITISEVKNKYELIKNELQINKSNLIDTSLFLVISRKDYQNLIVENINLSESNTSLKESNRQLLLGKNNKTNKSPIDAASMPKNDASESVDFAGASFDAYISESQNIKLFWKNKQGLKYNSLGNLKNEIEQQGNKLLFATNGGMFDEQRDPQGLYIENWKELKSIDLSANNYGNFYMNFGNEPKSNGIFIIKGDKKTGASQGATIIKANEISRNDLVAKYATQSGPILLYEGKINPNFTEGSTNLKYRSGVGIINSNKVVFAISKQPVNFHDFAKLFRDYFKCSTAMYLDGEISKMYIPDLNRIENGGDFGVIIGITKKSNPNSKN